MSIQLHTRAAAEGNGASAALTLGGVNALLAVLPAGTDCATLAAWAVAELAPLLPSPPFNPATGFRRLEALAVPPCSRVDVALGNPALVRVLAGVRIAPLDAWPSAGPL